MNYAHVENGAVSAYPFSDFQLRQANPNTSFPSGLDDETRAEWGMLPVIETPPAFDSRRQYVTQKATGQWIVGPNSVIATYTIHNRTLAERRDQLIERLKQKRWEVETAGVTVEIAGEPVPVSTNRGDDRTALHMEFSRLSAGIRPDGATFNFGDALPRAVSNADMMAAIGAALAHVQAAFDRQGVVQAMINGTSTHPAMDAAEEAIEEGWSE